MNKALQNYECEGQIDLFDYLKTIPEDKQPVTKYTCTIIGKECKAHSYKGCSMPGKCELLKQAVIGNNPEPKEPEPFINPPEEPKTEPTDDYIKEHPTCFYVFGHYLDREDGWHKVPDELPTFTEWTTIDVVLFGKKTGTPWMEHGKWEAKDWTFRSLDERRDTETIEVLAWKVSD